MQLNKFCTWTHPWNYDYTLRIANLPFTPESLFMPLCKSLPFTPPSAHQRDVFSVMCISLNVLKFYKWNYIVCTLFCLAFFSQQRLFWDLAVPLCASVIYSFLLLRSISLNVYTMLEDTFRPPLRLLRLSPKLGTKGNKKL